MTKQTRGRFWRYGPLILWMLFMSLASTSGFSAGNTSEILRPILLWFFPDLSESRIVLVHFLTRKAAHFTEYAVLAFLARRSFISSSHSFLRRYWFELGLLLIVVYGLLDEYHQSFVPSRTASIYDSAIDVAGGLTILMAAKFFSRNCREPETRSEAPTTV